MISAAGYSNFQQIVNASGSCDTAIIVANACFTATSQQELRYFVSFRQACLTQFSGLGTLVGFLFEEDNHGWTKAWRHSEGSGTWAGSV